MGAYNWILINDICPCCNKNVLIKCQTHIASDFSGDETGRFHEREYRIGQKMAWYPTNHQRYLEWKENGKIDNKDIPENIDYEVCYSTCTICDSQLCALIKFDNIIPVEVIEISKEEDWPTGFYR